MKKGRRNIYIYLWTILFLLPIFVFEGWLEKPFDINRIPLTGLVMIFCYYLIEIITLVTLILKREKSRHSITKHLFTFKLQLFWVALMIPGIKYSFELLISQSSINLTSISFILITIINLWALKDILYLRQHALEKMKLLSTSNL